MVSSQFHSGFGACKHKAVALVYVLFLCSMFDCCLLRVVPYVGVCKVWMVLTTLYILPGDGSFPRE